MLAEQRCVILDGALATELQRVHALSGEGYEPDAELWGTWALYRAPDAVLDVHRRYVDVGCDIITTDTWSILSMPDAERAAGPGAVAHWMDVARSGVRLARRAIADAGLEGERAVAFAISEEANSEARRDTLDLLARVWEEDPPDLILLETMTLIRDPATFETVQRLLDTGLPVWISFRRCRHGVCGVYGEHWGPPEGDLFGRAARRFEEMGVGALLINCLPVSHVPGMLSWLRDFTDLPLGVYPNLGHLAGTLWRFDDDVDPAEYARLAREWREEGAQIVGGCCGTTPEHIRAASAALEGTKPGNRRRTPGTPEQQDDGARIAHEPWLDGVGRSLYPLPFPELTVEQGVFLPTQGSYLCWKYLFRAAVGKQERCLDIGSGCGVLSVQLALNGATAVHAIDIDRNAVANTLANAFRNGVSDRVTGEAIDLYHWEPRERYDCIVASLYQMPVDPYEEPTGHRPLDYWGRNLVDRFIALLPDLLTDQGRAYLMQLSIVSQRRTHELLAQHGLKARVVDFSFFSFGPIFHENIKQIERVEELSDANHINLGGEDVMVAYLVEIERTTSSG
jgi:S-methylmethionine-dependent homocysteine/selenocysteine methylase